MDPIDLRARVNYPELSPMGFEGLSEYTLSDLSHSIKSLLSLDIYELFMFKNLHTEKETKGNPMYDVTMSEKDEYWIVSPILLKLGFFSKVQDMGELFEFKGRK